MALRQQGNPPLAMRSPSLPNMKRTNASPFANLQTFKPNRDSLDLHRQPQSTSMTSTSSHSSSKKSSLSSVLRAQSKFSGKSSVVSSKSRSIILKPAVKRSESSSSASASSDRLRRALPWANSSSGAASRTSSVTDTSKSFKKRVLGNDPDNRISTDQTLQSIDSNFEGITLSDEQQRVLDLVLNKRSNVFFTGSAGTGKSFLLRLIIKKLQTRYGGTNLGVCAPTGLAAANIGGKTINKLFGIGLGKEPVNTLLDRIKRKNEVYYVWRRLVAVIIDEVSMLDSDILVKLNELAKKIKRNDKPFGGMQVIICGDFLQLPPISNKANSANLNYCFKSHAWEEIIHTNIVLTKVFRQEGDSDLIDVLNALRVGQVDYKVESKLRQLSRPLKFDDGIEPTELFPTRAEVERSNQFRLMQLEGKEIEYIGKDTLDGNIQPDSNTQKSFESMMCVQSLKLKLGAQVILLKNDLYPELVNGQLGMIEAFLTKPVFLSYSARLGADNSSEKDRILAKISQIILKRRGFTDAEDAEDLSFFTDFQADLIREILGSYDDKDEILPHVRFIMPNSDRQVKFLIERQIFSPIEGPHAYTIRREQLPINLSWAISIHKSQGQTLPRVKVDLARIFEKGQLYVAISRCVSSKGLQVLNFDRRKVFVDGEVVNFYNEILRTRHLETVEKEDDQ